jgi:hypothetical protein
VQATADQKPSARVDRGIAGAGFTDARYKCFEVAAAAGCFDASALLPSG